MKTTNVKPSDLNYDAYTTSKYDRDIINSIPFHKELHDHIADFIVKYLDSEKEYNILDLGTGTGITAKLVQQLLPNSKIDVVDFSEQMIKGAKKKLGKKNVEYFLGDYSKMKFKKKYDMVISVIGIHHQNEAGKKNIFKKIFTLLKEESVFVFGDLMTCDDKSEAALNQSLHFHHLVEKSADRKTLREWAYHHLFLNDLATIEDQIGWLKGIGFKSKIGMFKFNTGLIIAKK